jgi:hypothetical protein
VGRRDRSRGHPRLHARRRNCANKDKHPSDQTYESRQITHNFGQPITPFSPPYSRFIGKAKPLANPHRPSKAERRELTAHPWNFLADRYKFPHCYETITHPFRKSKLNRYKRLSAFSMAYEAERIIPLRSK